MIKRILAWFKADDVPDFSFGRSAIIKHPERPFKPMPEITFEELVVGQFGNEFIGDIADVRG